MKLKATKETGGYSGNMVESLGMVFFGIAFAVVLVLFGVLIKKLFSKSKFVQKVALLCYDKICFNFFIRSFIAGYLVWALSCFKNILELDFSSPINGFSSVLAIITTVWCWSAPLITTIFITKNFKIIHTPKIANRIGTIYTGTNKNEMLAALYNVFFVSRRLFLAFVIVFFGWLPAF